MTAAPTTSPRKVPEARRPPVDLIDRTVELLALGEQRADSHPEQEAS